MTIQERLNETIKTAKKQNNSYIVAFSNRTNLKLEEVLVFAPVAKYELSKKAPFRIYCKGFWAVFGKISDCLSENSPENSYVKIFLEKCTKHEKEEENLTFESF